MTNGDEELEEGDTILAVRMEEEIVIPRRSPRERPGRRRACREAEKDIRGNGAGRIPILLRPVLQGELQRDARTHFVGPRDRAGSQCEGDP